MEGFASGSASRMAAGTAIYDADADSVMNKAASPAGIPIMKHIVAARVAETSGM